jgi:hypothetical protein
MSATNPDKHPSQPDHSREKQVLDGMRKAFFEYMQERPEGSRRTPCSVLNDR